jgi:transposase-like protein
MDKPKTLQQAMRHFSDEQVCIDTVAKLRWPNGVECPACGHKEHYWLDTQKRWKCKDCRRQFSVKLGTIFEDSPIKLDKWLAALWMLVNCKNGISSYEIGRALGITQKSAWFVMHRLRLAMETGTIRKMGGPSKEVEADETFIGGISKNMHPKRRIRLVKGGKTPVLGMLERGGDVRAMVVASRKRNALVPEIIKHVAEDTKLYTDALPSYDVLRTRYQHDSVDHAWNYVRGRVHTNGLENFWSLLKRGIKGTYVSVEPFHLNRYVTEQVFRYNFRAKISKPFNDAQRFELALSQVAGKRLTFAEVTGKDGKISEN